MRRSGIFSVSGKMRRSYRDMFLLLACFSFTAFLFSMHHSKGGSGTMENNAPVEESRTLTKSCFCESKKNSVIHNFCYIDPQNKTSIGRKFSCDSLAHLENLGTFNFSQKFVNTSDASRTAEDVVFLSACSDDHFRAAVESLKSVRKFYPNQKFILYSLGLSAGNRELFKKNENVEIRDFDFSKLPKYTTMWMQYRWKPLIIAMSVSELENDEDVDSIHSMGALEEVLKEFSNIWWMDAHIKVVEGNFTEIVYQERAENKVLSDIIFFVHSSHSNFAVMIPTLLKYIPSNSTALLKSEDFGAQLGANVFYVSRTRQTLEFFKWWLLCALDETCMNPPTAQVYCSFGPNRFDSFANCFRFDQSVINLLLLNKFQDYHKYTGSVGYKFDR